MYRPGIRKVLVHLICVNVIVLPMKTLLLVTEYKLHFIQASFKTVAYSIKLKLEFSVLNQLCSFFSTSLSIHAPETKQQPHKDEMSSSRAILTHSDTTSGEVRHAPSRSNGAQEQLEYERSPHETLDDSHQSVDFITPPSSPPDDSSGHTLGDWPVFPSVLELSLSQISAKSDV
jgi:hypothetical protein